MPTQPQPFLAVILSPTVWPPALPVTMGEDRGRGALEKRYERMDVASRPCLSLNCIRISRDHWAHGKGTRQREEHEVAR